MQNTSISCENDLVCNNFIVWARNSFSVIMMRGASFSSVIMVTITGMMMRMAVTRIAVMMMMMAVMMMAERWIEWSEGIAE